MAYTKDTFKTLFQSKFDLPKWQFFLSDYFKTREIRTSPEFLYEDSEDYAGYFLGSMESSDHYKLGFFYYRMEDGSVLRRKVGLRNLIKPYLRYGFDAALAVFDDGNNWRLSLICDLDDEATNTKRFTYVFGDERALYKTPVSRFFGLRNDTDKFLSIREAFSVDALSDDFFDEYRKQYAEFVKFITGKEYVKKNGKWVEQSVGEPDAQFASSFGSDEKMVRDYIKKMMGRIVFLYFLQSKGWLAGNLHYMHDLFYSASDTVKDDFLDKVLEPMFFGLLNTKTEDRATAPLVNGVGVKYIPDADSIPYLNGGLFQQEEIDKVDSRFPAEMFESLFDFFDSYNFTIDENDPNDAEVGVDPEMLGKIFENLLEDNKDKGAFYTPKEIVRYMCQESLIAYLQTGIEDEDTKKHIANFVKTYDAAELGGTFSELAMSVDLKLKNVKICDPAIGSGAFPMGLLRELYGCRKAIEIFGADNAADIKRHIIQNNIYGVDIEKGAVDIARLRFWLALIIDEKEPMPLPNLDFKIMQGNSLLESYKGVDLNITSKKIKTGKDTKKTRGVLSLGFEETDIQKIIQDLVKSYFSITDHTLRAQRRNEIDKYVKDYIKICAEGNQEIQASVDELEIPNDQFFLWHTYFNDVFENGGFDIVIGNPPYKIVPKCDPMKKMYENLFTVAHGGKRNLYHLFFEKGFCLLKKFGVLSYITPDTYFSGNDTIALREFFVNHVKILNIVHYTEKDKVFDNVTQAVAVVTMIADKASVKSTFEIIGRESNSTIKYSCLTKDTNYLFKSDNVVVARMKQALFTFNDITKSYKGDVNLGLKKSFFVKEEYSETLPLVRGVQISRYSYTKGEEYCYKKALTKNETGLERIVLQEVANMGLQQRIKATILKDVICGDSCNLIYSIDKTITNNIVLAILNSKLVNYYFKYYNQTNHVPVGELRKIPFPKVANKEKAILNFLAMKALASQNKEVRVMIMTKIDFLVYHLYGLTYDEVLVVDPTPPFTREQYESDVYEK